MKLPRKLFCRYMIEGGVENVEPGTCVPGESQVSNLGALRDPVFHVRVQNVERQRAAAHDFVMKGAEIKLIAQLSPRLLAQLEDFQLAQLVGQRLAGP